MMSIRRVFHRAALLSTRGKKTTKDVTIPFPAMLPQLFSPFSPTSGQHFMENLGQTLMNNSPAFPSSIVEMDLLPMDITEHTGTYELLLDVPGVSHDDCHCDMKGHVLTVTVDRKAHHVSGHGAKVRKSERFRGHVVRSVDLPLDADADPAAVSASLSHGVLKIVVKKVPHAERKEIAIPIAIAE